MSTGTHSFLKPTPRNIVALVILLIIAFMPVIAPAIGQPYYESLFVRIMLWSIAALSLNFILGFGGMISFGHAVYVGIGGYTVGILAYYEIHDAWIHFPLTIVLSALFALVFGAICLRTKGVYFIMITLAFAQMVYFLSLSVEEYGSDDGMSIYDRTDFGVDWFDINDDRTFYYLTFAVLLFTLFVFHRLVQSRFGMVLRGAKSNEVRLQAIGIPVFRYKLAAFVIAGVFAGISGALTANFEDFVSPDMMSWIHSGDLIFMVVLGGMGTFFGPVTGTVIFLFLSEVLRNMWEHWHLIFGPFLVLVVLFLNRGADSLFDIAGKLFTNRKTEAGE